jgi:hypothetical protein
MLLPHNKRLKTLFFSIAAKLANHPSDIDVTSVRANKPHVNGFVFDCPCRELQLGARPNHKSCLVLGGTAKSPNETRTRWSIFTGHAVHPGLECSEFGFRELILFGYAEEKNCEEPKKGEGTRTIG